MIKYILPFLLLGLPFLSKTQIVLTNNSFPKVGDTLFSHIDFLPGSIIITEGGANRRWDFSTLQSPFARQLEVLPAHFFEEHRYFPKANASAILQENQLGFYKIGEQKITLMGYVGNDPLSLGLNQIVYFDPPLVEKRAPLRYHDGFQTESNLTYSFALEDLPKNEFEALPFTPDSFRVSITIDRQDYVDAWGVLLIPGGIYDVLRERRQEAKTVRLEARIGRSPWQDVTDLLPGSDIVGSFYSVTYYYHSNSSQNPIAVAYLDGEEKKLLNVIYKALRTTENVQMVGSVRPGIYAYPNPAIVNVRFEFTNLQPGIYKLTIFNILGLEEWSKTYYVNGHRTEKVNISGLRKGSYLYSLTDERGKTISTKRLIVIKP